MSIDTNKIIHGVVGGGRYTVTSPIIKEDYGLYLKIEGLELPSTYEVDFSNSEHNGTSITMIGDADGVLIPSQFIATGKDVFAFLYHVGADFGRTIYKFRIPNKLRPDRTNEQPTPEEQSTIDQAISALNSAVSATAQDVIDANASAQSASDDADRAEEAKTDAQNFATQAEQSATSASQSASQASTSATASAQSASQSAQIKDDVEGMVDDAQASASASAQSASASANSASQASASATSASQSATSAQGYASQAQTSAQTATAKATEASTSASTASAKATKSAQSASQALTYKNDAEQAKTASQTAQGLAESARDDAISAKEDAEDARDEAQSIVDGISGKTEQIDSNTERIESLEDDRYKPYAVDTASGLIASFSDGADDIPLKSLIVNINPVQDLHGYDSPWVAGGGKNKFKVPNDYGSYTNSGVTITVLENEYVITGTSTNPRAIDLGRHSYDNYYTTVRLHDDFSYPAGTYTISVVKSNPNSVVGAIVGTNLGGRYNAEGNSRISFSDSPITVTFEEPWYFTPYTSFVTGEAREGTIKIQVEEGSTATAWTPYENICPISGWTGCEVGATGKNLFDEANATIYPRYFRLASSEPNLWEPDSNSTSFVFRCKPNTTYTVSCDNANITIFRIGWIAENPDALTGNPVINDAIRKTASGVSTITTGANAKAIVIQLNRTVGIVKASKMQIELGSTRTDYVPYVGQTIPISWQTEAGTVYGGKLDVLSGVMRIEMADVDLGTLTWTYQESYHRFNSSGIASRVKIPSSSNVNIGGLCSAYVVRSVSQVILNDNGLGVSTSGTIGIIDTRFTDPTEFKTAVDGVHYVYPLETLIEIQLTPHEVNSLLGQNNIFADTGDTEVTYRADPTLYIQRLTEPDVDMIADSNIVSGQYFMVGNNLYKATANIASGAQVIVGTNATRKSLAQALNEINA